MINIYSHNDNSSKYKNIRQVLLIDQTKHINPLVSIVIPTYNRPKLLKETLDSAINQNTKIPLKL